MNKKIFLDKLFQVLNYLRENIKILFLVGVFTGLVFVSYYIIKVQIIDDEYVMAYKATIESEIICEEGCTLNASQVEDMLYGSDIKNALINNLGSEEAYLKCIEDVDMKLVQNMLTVSCTNLNRNDAIDFIILIYDILSDLICEEDKVLYTRSNETPITTLVRYKVNSDKGIGITYFAEIGIIVGVLLGAIVLSVDFLTRGNVKDELDIYKHFNLPLLANIPHIDESGEEDEKD